MSKPTDADSPKTAPDSPNTDRVDELLAQFRPLEIPYPQRIFANRNLRLGSVKMIGYDMDYTLADYHVAVEELQVELTLKKLVSEYGYPERALELQYDPEFAIRGLTVDKRRGNLLKMDCHKHISRVFHGTRPLKKAERRRLYRQETIRFSGSRYALLDTLFAVPEAWLFAALVDLIEEDAQAEAEARGRKPRAITAKRYVRLYDDIRASIDRVHADQSLKNIITADMAKYIRKDKTLAHSLHRLRQSGKKLFLMTNSYGPYTTAVMTYLLSGEREDYPDWKDYFDIIVVGAKKPSFFTKGSPFLPLGADLKPDGRVAERFERGQLYEGGNLADFERLSGFSGDAILYVGDHLYGDILRSKKDSTWRTAMIVPELDRELSTYETLRKDFEQRNELETHRQHVDAELHREQQALGALTEFVNDRQRLFEPEERRAFEHALEVSQEKTERLEKTLHAALGRIWRLNRRLERAFNPYWGMLFKSRAEHSMFGEQIEDYACVYTSKPSNFGFYSPFQYFRTPRDLLPHEHQTMEQTDGPDYTALED